MGIHQDMGYTISFVHKQWLTVGTFNLSFHSVLGSSGKPNKQKFKKKMVGDVINYVKR